jgi:hypothetical protein
VPPTRQSRDDAIKRVGDVIEGTHCLRLRCDCHAAEILPRVRTANKRSVTIFPSDLAASIYRPAGDAAHNAMRQRLSFDELKCERLIAAIAQIFLRKQQS